MANPEHLAIIEKGIRPWNAWRYEHPDQKPDLSGSNLHGVFYGQVYINDAHLSRVKDEAFGEKDDRRAIRLHALTEANLHARFLADVDAVNLADTNLEGAQLSLADLTGANLSGATLIGAHLNDARLLGANLIKANLNGAELSRANLTRANLSGATLVDANLSRARLGWADLLQTDFTGADLRDAYLVGTTAIGTNFARTNLTHCRIYGISAWNVELEGAIQSNLIVNEYEPFVQVDDLEVAQFVYLLLDRSKLRKMLTTLGEKAVLILGRFAERKELLDGIANKLRSLGYLPIIFDFQRPENFDLTETVKILAGLSRFVIADITNPRSVPLELQSTVPDYMVPFVTILQRGQPAFGMFDDLPVKYHWALPLLEYNTGESLLHSFEEKVVGPALEKLQEVRRMKALPVARRSAED
jgi:uncharacterized protein YjbI with pentapeptide repeats